MSANDRKARGRIGGLGKGLDALFADNDGGEENQVRTVAISEVEPNAEQPRKAFEEGALAELADSIRANGLLQPLLVRPTAQGRYQIVAGERRWRASRMAGLTQLPVIVRELTDRQVMEMALIENLQREALNPVEEAQGYRYLMDTYNLTQEQVAQQVGKSRPAVANAVRLLQLPQTVLKMVEKGELSVGHAKVLVGIRDEELSSQLAQRAVKSGMSVREMERMASHAQGRGGKDPAKEERRLHPGRRGPDPELLGRDSFYKEMELALSEELHRRVKITQKEGKGTLEVDFFNKEELADLVARIAKTQW